MNRLTVCSVEGSYEALFSTSFSRDEALQQEELDHCLQGTNTAH